MSPILPTQLKSVLLAFAALLAPAAARGQAPPETPQPGDPEVTVELSGRARSRFRIAVPSPTGLDRLSGDLAAAARELDATLRADLEASGVFELQGPAELAVLALTGDPERDFELYRSLRNELLLDTEVKPDGSRLVLEGRVFELANGRSLLGKRYRGIPAVARRIAHTFADELILFFSGRRGVSLTTIAFSSDRDGNKEIYLMDYDGANQRPITAHKSISLGPDWSPAGEAIAYVSYFDGAPGIYLADVSSGAKRGVATDGELNISPSFAPDGKRLAFARSIDQGNIEIFVAGRDGRGRRQLTHSSGIDTGPAWSPTGREIAFTSSRAGSPQIYVMDTDGANLRRISFDGDYNDGAAWSPDGTRVAYATRRRGGFDIAVTDVVTLETRLLTNGGGSHEAPGFSPDGRKIVFASKGPGGVTQIWVMDADGSARRQLTSAGNNSAPAWSGYPR